MTPRKTARNKAPQLPAWVPLALVVTAAFAVGVFVLPRLSGGGLEGAMAPDFALPVVYGGERDTRVRLSEQRGTPVLLDFWASWCQPCREQAKVIEAVRARNPALRVLGINVSDEPNAAQRHLSTANPQWLVVQDSGVANAAYQVEALPTLVLIAADGKVFAVRRRFVPERELLAMLAALGA